MEQFISLEFSIFAMMAVGVLISKTGLAGKETRKVITDLVLYVILPCNIFHSFLGGRADIGGGDYLAILLVSIVVQLLSLLYGKVAFPKESADRRCNLAFAMICSNAGFLGNAITDGLYGAAGMMLTSVYLIPQRLMIWSQGPALYAGFTGSKKDIIKKALTHPCILACLLGLLFMACNINVPAFLRTPIQSIGRCSTPLIMMMIGMILSEVDFRQLVDRTMLRFTVHRLLLMPLIVYGICLALPVSRYVRDVSVLLSAMPAGTITTMLAAKYQRDPSFAARLLVLTTLCSIPAILLWSVILRLS